MICSAEKLCEMKLESFEKALDFKRMESSDCVEARVRVFTKKVQNSDSVGINPVVDSIKFSYKTE